MTDSDLRVAREAVAERSSTERQRGRRRTLAAVAAAAVAIPVLGVTAFRSMDGEDDTAPASPAPASPDSDDTRPEGSAPTAELVQGVWRVDNGTTVVRLSSAGEFSLDDSGQLFSDPFLSGTYAIEGNLVTFSVESGPAECAGQTIDMTTSLPETGSMRMLKSPNVGCALEQNGQWLMEQMVPLRSDFLNSFAVPATGNWKPLAGAAVLHGLWVPVDGGHVLEMDPDGAYFVADESGKPIERGQWTLRDADLTFSPSMVSEGCSEQIVLGGVEQVGGGTINIGATVIGNPCGSGWAASGEWFLLPHVGREP